MKPEKVDKLICDWSLKTGHAFQEKELNSLVELISSESEKEVFNSKIENRIQENHTHTMAKLKELLEGYERLVSMYLKLLNEEIYEKKMEEEIVDYQRKMIRCVRTLFEK